MRVKKAILKMNRTQDLTPPKELVISNIKYSCFVNKLRLKDCMWKTRHQDGSPGDFGSYLCRKFSGFTYFAFPCSGTLNVANCKKEEDIVKSLELFMEKVGLTEQDIQSPTKINNLTAVGCLGKEVNLSELAETFCDSEIKDRLNIKFISLSQHHFVCLRLKLKTKGLISIFSSGKINLVGFDNLKTVDKIYNDVCNVIVLV